MLLPVTMDGWIDEWIIMSQVDSAVMYRNEKACGQGIINSNIDRSELFFTTKVPPGSMGYERTKRQVEMSLREVELEYIDLFVSYPWSTTHRRKKETNKKGPPPRPLRRQRSPSRLLARLGRSPASRQSPLNRSLQLRRPPP